MKKPSWHSFIPDISDEEHEVNLLMLYRSGKELCEMLWGNFYNINKFNGGYKIKQILTSLIRTYQHIAPKSLRESCRFEPSCSNYMILAIEKHGSVKGVLMGIQRLSKCRYPNGGIDYP